MYPPRRPLRVHPPARAFGLGSLSDGVIEAQEQQSTPAPPMRPNGGKQLSRQHARAPGSGQPRRSEPTEAKAQPSPPPADSPAENTPCTTGRPPHPHRYRRPDNFWGPVRVFAAVLAEGGLLLLDDLPQLGLKSDVDHVR